MISLCTRERRLSGTSRVGPRSLAQLKQFGRAVTRAYFSSAGPAVNGGQDDDSAVDEWVLVVAGGQAAPLLEKGANDPRQTPVTPRSAHQPSKLSQRLSYETVAAIVAAYIAGATTREVGERFGLAHSSVNKLLQQGITARRRSPSEDEVQRAVKLYEAGQSTRTIAEHLGFGASTIARALVAAGVTMRRRLDR